MSHPPPLDAFLHAAMLAEAEEDLRFFSNRSKQEQERWIVGSMLRCMQIVFTETELLSMPQASKTDVQFRSANFQVKEIVTPGMRRSGDVKDTYNRLRAAKNYSDLLGTSIAYDIPPPTTIYELVAAQASTLSKDARYASEKGALDLLFYVTHVHASHIRAHEIRLDELESLGWRSICCLAGSIPTVLHANNDAPEFLRNRLAS